MPLIANKYYSQDGKVYLCVVGTDEAVDTPLSELTDNVILYEDPEEGQDPSGGGDDKDPDGSEEPDTGDGDDPVDDGIEPTGDSKEDPIVWVLGSKLYNGKYYIDQGVVYYCKRDSGIELSYHLADLISGGYVDIVS